MNTHDITIRYQEAARLLAAGKLIKDDHFSLFEAVGALEIADPKMDSGCLEPGESLEDTFDMSRDFLPEELVWLMDQILNREVAWLMGYPLSQTLFTSVHIDRLLWPDPKTLRDAVFVRGGSQSMFLSHQILQAYCSLLTKACDLVLTMVTSQHYYEEEDFTTQLFNRELLHRFSEDDIKELGASAIEAVQGSHIEPKLKEALLARLEFRMEILEMLMHHAHGMSPSESLFSLLRGHLNDQQHTHSVGRPIESAFSTKLQRRLASTVPPRPMVTVSMDAAWSFWQRIVEDCNNVFSVQAADCSTDLFTAYLVFAYMNPQPSTYPRALLQSFLALNDGLVGGRIDSLQFLEEDLCSLTLPASNLLSISGGIYGRLYNGNQKVAQSMQSFIDRFEHTFTNLYRALCLNGCRIRRTFCHALLEWDSKQGEIEDLETVIQMELREQPTAYPASHGQPSHAFPLSSWVYHHKLNILRLTIQMGFEQMIYAPHELAGMYYYLSAVCTMHLNHLERISHFVTLKDAAIKSSQLHAPVKQQAAEECKRALNRLFRQYAFIKATQMLASTVHYIFALLQRHRILTASKPLYSSDDLRYDIRMKPFLTLSAPECFSAEVYRSETEMGHISTETLLEQALEVSGAARKAWEEVTKSPWHVLPTMHDSSGGSSHGSGSILEDSWYADMKDCLKASIAASLCVMNLKKGLGNEVWRSKAQSEARVVGVEETGRWHRWWIVPSLPAM